MPSLLHTTNAAILNSSPRTPQPPRSACLACLSKLTHLIQIFCLLEVRSVHELCSDWHAPYTRSIAPYSLSRGNPLKFSSLRNIHSWICAEQHLHTRTRMTIYLCKYVQFKFTSRTRQCTLNGIYTFTSNWNHGGISCDVPFAWHLRSNRTNVWNDKLNFKGSSLTSLNLNKFLLEDFQRKLTQNNIKTVMKAIQWYYSFEDHCQL